MQNKRIAIIDYGMGNLRNVQKALEFIGANAIISNNEDEILCSDGIVLPGVGAFPDAMENLITSGLDKVIKTAAYEGKPLMGICLGMQLLFNESDEVRKTTGLGLLKGKIRRFEVDLKVPHMGWNSLMFDKRCQILNNIKEYSYVYFVHSYLADIEEKGILNAYCNYQVDVPAIVSKGNVFGLQFHPEKSGDAGIQMLKNFWEMVK